MNVFKEIEPKLAELQKRKDKVEELSRAIIRLAGKSIALMHANRQSEASKLIARLKQLAKRLDKLDDGLEYFSLQAKQEYVEALALYEFVKSKRLISYNQAEVEERAYLLGMLDLVGELKRQALEALRKGNAAYANECYKAMVEINDSALPLKFANSLIPELRKKQDTARIQLESLASEINKQTV